MLEKKTMKILLTYWKYNKNNEDFADLLEIQQEL